VLAFALGRKSRAPPQVFEACRVGDRAADARLGCDLPEVRSAAPAFSKALYMAGRAALPFYVFCEREGGDMKLPITAATLALTAGLGAPAASGADFWLQGRYSGPMVKRNCDTHSGQFYMHGGLSYGCELAGGRAVECTENHECRAHVAGSSALPPSPRTLQGFLGAEEPVPPQARPLTRIERKP
jgi:hypothetical protein